MTRLDHGHYVVSAVLAPLGLCRADDPMSVVRYATRFIQPRREVDDVTSRSLPRLQHGLSHHDHALLRHCAAKKMGKHAAMLAHSSARVMAEIGL